MNNLKNTVSKDLVALWYEKAIVRYIPRIIIPDYSIDELPYPLVRCIICEHPIVKALGNKVRSYILLQAAYQFLYSVGLLETKFVIKCSLDIIHNDIDNFDDIEKLQALTVIIDEGYHAYAALDYACQLKSKSGIEPIFVPDSNRKLDAYARAQAALPEEMQMDFQLLAVTLAENVLTDEIANVGREEGVASSFSQLMVDHVKDEGRHSQYFTKLMKSRWLRMPEATKERLNLMMSDYLDDFLGADLERSFEQKILELCGLEKETANRVISETHSRFLIEHEEATKKTKARLYRILTSMGILSSGVKVGV